MCIRDSYSREALPAEKRPDCCHPPLEHFLMRSSARKANERARGQRLWRNGRNEPARQAAPPPRPAAPPSISRKAAAGGRGKLASSCDSELRLQPQLDTPSPRPGAWLPPRPEQTGVSAAPRHRRRLPLHPQIRALAKLALSCGFSRSSTHRAPWGVAPATPRTNRCVCCAAVQSSPSSSSSLWAQTSAASSL